MSVESLTVSSLQQNTKEKQQLYMNLIGISNTTLTEQ
jgi:hypothetical protein